MTGNEAGVTGCSITGFLAGIHIAGTNTNVDSVNLYGNFDGLEIFPVATGGLITESFFINNEDSGIVSKANGLGGNTITRSYIDTLDQPCQAFVVTEVTADILIEDTAVLGNPHAVGFAFRGREMGSSVRLKNVISCFQTNFQLDENVTLNEFAGVTCDIPPSGFSCENSCPVC